MATRTPIRRRLHPDPHPMATSAPRARRSTSLSFPLGSPRARRSAPPPRLSPLLSLSTSHGLSLFPTLHLLWPPRAAPTSLPLFPSRLTSSPPDPNPHPDPLQLLPLLKPDPNHLGPASPPLLKPDPNHLGSQPVMPNLTRFTQTRPVSPTPLTRNKEKEKEERKKKISPSPVPVSVPMPVQGLAGLT